LIEKIKSLVPTQDNQVIDLAAGTGLMTLPLFNSGINVTAIEPVENMRKKLNEVVPQVTCLDGTSWNMPVQDASVDAVVIAQAFHWFDDIKTLQELHRVLKPKGYGVLAWNLESRERSDWVGDFRE
jgi:ubiquinone/menaquinone biosynthesis C-methylase UbiE